MSDVSLEAMARKVVADRGLTPNEASTLVLYGAQVGLAQVRQSIELGVDSPMPESLAEFIRPLMRLKAV